MDEDPFPWDALLPLLSRNSTICRGILGIEVVTQGSGPYEESEFDDFLTACGIEVRAIAREGASPRVAILGRQHWDAGDVDSLRYRTLGDDIRVYSQEMVIASMAIGTDVIEMLEGDVSGFVDGHEALERFYWEIPDVDQVSFPRPPSAEEQISRKLLVDLDTGDWPKKGVLSAMGYRAGRDGLSSVARRSILQDVLSVELVAATPAAHDYIEEWGQPRTWQRLQKMVNAIAAFARSARRRSGDYSQAIADWDSDVDWLRETFASTD